MTELKKVDILLKRYLKGRFSVTQSLVVTFLITGAISFGATAPEFSVAQGEQETGYVQESTYKYGTTPGLIPVPEVPTITFVVDPTKENEDTLYNHEIDEIHRKDVIKTEGNVGALVFNGHDYTNHGTIANIGDFGAGVVGGIKLESGQMSEGGELTNKGTIANTGNVGMFAVGGDLDYKFMSITKQEFEESKIVNEGTIKNTGSVGMLALQGAEAINKGTVENTGDYGMLASGVQFYKDGVENHGSLFKPKYDQHYDNERSVAINESRYEYNDNHYDEDHDHDKCEGQKTLVVGTIANTGSVGMGAFDGAFALNEGIIKNGKDYGMLASGGEFADKHTGELFEGTSYESEHEKAFDFIESKVENEAEYVYIYKDHPHPEKDGQEHGDECKPHLVEKVLVGGIIRNKGDVGMGALDGAVAINKGLIENGKDETGAVVGTGNFGMLAAGGVFEPVRKDEHEHGGPDCEHESHNKKPQWDKEKAPDFIASKAVNTEDGIINNAGDIGMAALAGAVAENKGLIENDGDWGMVAEGYAKYVPSKDEWDHDIEDKEDGKGPKPSWNHGQIGGGNHNETIYHSKVINEKHGVVENAGDVGMAALNGGLALNYGLVMNGGTTGMLASGTDTLAVNYGYNLTTKEIHKHDDNCGHGGFHIDDNENKYSKENTQYGGIQNKGSYGMVALNGATVINKGLIKNGGDVGMYIGQDSHGENWGLDSVKIEHDGPSTLDRNDGHWYQETVEAGIHNIGNVGVFVDGNGTFANYGTIVPENKLNPTQTKLAILTGTGNNVVKLGMTSKMEGDLLNLGGTDILYLGSNPKTPQHPEDDDEYDGWSEGHGNPVQDSNHHNWSNTLDSNVWFYSYLIGGNPLKPKYDESGNCTGWEVEKHPDPEQNKEFNWTITKNVVLLPGLGVPNVINPDYGTVTDADYLRFTIENRDQYKGNITVGKEGLVNGEAGANVAMIIGRRIETTQELSSPAIVANSLDIIKGSGTLVNYTLDRAYITNGNNLLVTNIYTNGVELCEDENGKLVANNKYNGKDDYDHRENGGISISGVDLSKYGTKTTIDGKEVYLIDSENIDSTILTENVADGWKASYIYDAEEGTLTLVVNREAVLGGDSDAGTVYGVNTVRAAGGYDVANYPQNNLDEVNARRITDKGYLYARRAAFMAPVVTTVQETVQYPAAPMDKGVKAAPVVTEKGKEVAPPPVIEEVVETKVYKNYDNLQYAEVFGDWGKYSGDGAEYSYDTYGVTGATFHRFDPNWLAGLAYGYAHSKVDYDNLNGSDENIDTLGLNGYVSYQNNNWLVTGQAGYAWSRHDLNRYTIDGDSAYINGAVDLKRKLDKKFDSNAATVGIEVGYNYKIDDTSYLYPYAGIDYVWSSRDSYSENTDGWTGTPGVTLGDSLDGYGVHVDKNDYNTAVTKLGLMGQAIYERWTFTGDIAWMHYFSDYDNLTGYYIDDPGARFESYAQDPGKDVGYIMLAADYAVNEQLSVGADFTGYYRSNQTSSQVGLNLTYKF